MHCTHSRHCPQWLAREISHRRFENVTNRIRHELLLPKVLLPASRCRRTDPRKYRYLTSWFKNISALQTRHYLFSIFSAMPRARDSLLASWNTERLRGSKYTVAICAATELNGTKRIETERIDQSERFVYSAKSTSCKWWKRTKLLWNPKKF